jgi:glutathione S-transferase
MIRLVQFHPAFGLRNLSPFCLKLETYLRLTRIPHEVVLTNDTRRAPKGKLPYIVDGERTLGDSALIIDDLKQRYGDPLDATLDAAQKAETLAWRALCEDHLLFALLYSRWVDADGWQITRRLFAGLPLPLRPLVPGIVRRAVTRQVYAQGMGRHRRDEIYAFGVADVAALATLLGDKAYMLADAPCSLDATVYGFLAQLVDGPYDNPLTRQARATPTLVAYCQRIKQRCFADAG